jgi:two-component system, NtrC family, sensor kinase
MSPHTILVVDDNRQIANYLSEKILPGLGYETRTAYDGISMRTILHKEKISLMLLDFQLAETTGLALLRELNEEGFNVPTILIVAQGSEQIALDAFHLGVQDYLTKPVDSDNLDIAINRVLTGFELRKEKENLAAQLNEQVSWLQVLSKIGKSVTSSLELDEVLRRIAEAGVYLTHAEEGFLSLLDEESGQLYLRAAKNIEEEESKLIHLLVSDSVPGTVIKTLKPFRMSQTLGGTKLKVSTGFLVTSFLHVPLILKGKALGVLSVDNRRSKRENP